jgi:pimeloyl-ACP methyl ester carboxylesterase
VDTIRANGVDFAYLTEGSGPLVLLLHGFPDTARTWDRSMRALADAGYRAVAPYMRGYHPTSIPSDGRYDSDTLGRDALALIEALGEERAAVVGHDWGASAAYCAAALGPDRVRLLVTMAIPHPRSIKPGPRIGWRLRHFLNLRRANAGKQLRANSFALVDTYWSRWSPAWKDVPASETTDVKRAFAEPGCAEAAAAYYKAVGVRFPEGYKPQIKMPAVSIAGEHDIIPPRLYEKARLCFDGSYEVVIVPGGHFMHREHPDVFTTELVRTIREHVPIG